MGIFKMKELLVAVVLLLCTTVATEGNTCSDSGTTYVNGLNENEHDVRNEIVRYGHYIELDCCVPEGNKSIVSWMKWDKAVDKWQTYTPDRTEVGLYDNKQILAIESASFDDEGAYKCSIQNETSVTDVTQFHVDVVACDKLARGPYPTTPLPCPEMTTRERETLTLPCTGYFGCGDEGDIRIVTWFVSLDKNKKDDWKEAISVDKRYTQIDFQQGNGEVRGSNLTITDVSAIDFNRKFMCLLASPQTVHGQSKIVVTLKNSHVQVSEASSSTIAILAGISVLLCLSLIINVVIAVFSFYERPQIVSRTIKGTSDPLLRAARMKEIVHVI